MTTRGITRLKIWLVVLGVFILGGVTGASLDSVYRMRAGGEGWGMRGRRGHKLFEKMKRHLNLTNQQAEQTGAILEETRNEYDAARQRARARIRVLLTPEQQQKFDAWAAEHDARRNGDER